MAPKIIYIAGFRQHAGKTMTSLGLISMLKKYIPEEDIGYFKPVGQEMYRLPDGRRIDKDGRIIEEFVLKDINLDYVSPVQLISGVSKEIIKSPHPEDYTNRFEKQIYASLEGMKEKKVIIAEGTGHPGVGGIANLSNSRVSKLLGAEIIYLAGGGLGKTLDMLEVDMTYFHTQGACVKGLIFNKLIPEKINSMKTLLTEDYINKHYPSKSGAISILGYLPEIERMNRPSMELIYESFPGAVAVGNVEEEAGWKVPSNGVTIVSLSHDYFVPEDYVGAGDIVLLSAYSKIRLKNLLDYNHKLPKEKQIAGIILTCMNMDDVIKDSMKRVAPYGIPVFYVRETTTKADAIVDKCINNTKLQTYDYVKMKQIENLFENHFDTEKFIDVFNIKS